MNPREQSAPQPFGRYVLERRIAMGGMAEIYLARQQGPAGFSRPLVIKRILPHLAEEPSFVEMFFDEAKLAASLTHPNIVSVHDFGEVDGDYFIAMELVRGPDLKRVLQANHDLGRPPPVRVAAKIVSLAAEALEYAHRLTDADGNPLRLIHRDVSSSNIVVSYDGAVKLLDFGIAKANVSRHKTRTGFLKGKISYMAPEQLEGRSVDLRADIYALGVVLYEQCTGRAPFGGDSDLLLMQAICGQSPLPPRALNPEVPERLDRAMMKALAKDPSERWQSARAFGAEIERFIVESGEQVSTFEISEWLQDLAENAREPLDAIVASGGSYGSMKRPEPPLPQDEAQDAQAPAAQASAGAAMASTPGDAALGDGSDVFDTDVSASPPRAADKATSVERDTERRRASSRGDARASDEPPDADVKDEAGLQLQARGVRGGAGGIGEAQGSEAPRASDEPPDAIDTERITQPRSAPAVRGRPGAGEAPPRQGRALLIGGGSVAALAAVAIIVIVVIVGGRETGLDAPPDDVHETQPAHVAATGAAVEGEAAMETEHAVDAAMPDPSEDGEGAVGAEAEAPSEETPRDDGAAGEVAAATEPDQSSEPEVAVAKVPAPETRRPVRRPAKRRAPDRPGHVTLHTVPWTEIHVDGEPMGATPRRIELPPGRHEVRLLNTEAGIDHRTVLEVGPGSDQRLRFDLRTGRLAIFVRPWGDVYVDGRKRGTTPMPPLELPVGRRTIRVVHPDSGRSEERTVELRAGETETVRFNLGD